MRLPLSLLFTGSHPIEQIEDHPLVSFLPLNLSSTDSLDTVVSHIDFVMQYGEDEEPREVSQVMYGSSVFTHSLFNAA